MKLVCFGDSLTWGLYGGSYVDALRVRLPDTTILNAGEGGNTVVNLLRRVQTDVITHAPDAVFVMVGGNDAISCTQPRTRPYYTKAQKIETGFVPPDVFEAAYRDLIAELTLASILVYIGLPPIEYSPTTVRALSDYNARACRAAEGYRAPTIDLLAALNPPIEAIPERPPLDLSFIQTIGARERAGWCDYETARAAEGYTYTFDGLHFTLEGAVRAADLIAGLIQLS